MEMLSYRLLYFSISYNLLFAGIYFFYYTWGGFSIWKVTYAGLLSLSISFYYNALLGFYAFFFGQQHENIYKLFKSNNSKLS